MSLEKYGWDNFFESCFKKQKGDGIFPARVVKELREEYLLISEHGPLKAEISGKFRYESSTRHEFPSVGDFVVARFTQGSERAIILSVLPRKTKVSRKFPVGSQERRSRKDDQLIVSNIDYLFIVVGLDNDFNIRRIERYLALAAQSKVIPVVILNKADLCENTFEYIDKVKKISKNIDVYAISAEEKKGLENISRFLTEGITIALLGSSGAGKSTIINVLLGEEKQTVAPVRKSDSRGLHTTTTREMLFLPQGGMIIDNPGIREIHLWLGKDEIEDAFEDIYELSEKCFFSDCRHINEPKCAVIEAVKNGEIEQKRVNNFLTLKKESETKRGKKNTSKIKKK